MVTSLTYILTYVKKFHKLSILIFLINAQFVNILFTFPNDIIILISRPEIKLNLIIHLESQYHKSLINNLYISPGNSLR